MITVLFFIAYAFHGNLYWHIKVSGSIVSRDITKILLCISIALDILFIVLAIVNTVSLIRIANKNEKIDRGGL